MCIRDSLPPPPSSSLLSSHACSSMPPILSGYACCTKTLSYRPTHPPLPIRISARARRYLVLRRRGITWSVSRGRRHDPSKSPLDETTLLVVFTLFAAQ
eukprot:1862735-Rhodomonas_salina.1